MIHSHTIPSDIRCIIKLLNTACATLYVSSICLEAQVPLGLLVNNNNAVSLHVVFNEFLT
jgi:hypothetical protein